MKKTISFYNFCDEFSEDRKNTFSYEGKEALFNYLEEYEDSTGEQIELDTVALCCEYTEFEDLAEYNAQYDYNGQKAESIEEVEEKTQVIRIEGKESFIIQNY